MIDYDQAVYYLKKRLDIENRGNEKIKRIIVNAFSDLIAFAFPCALTAQSFKLDLLPNKEKIDEILRDMRTQIYLTIVECCNLVAQSRKEAFDDLGFVFSVEDVLTAEEKSIRDKSYIYSRRLTKEFETWIALGLFYSWSTSRLKSTFENNISSLYSNNLFAKASTSAKFSATRLKNGGVSFGAGQYKSALSALKRLSIGAIGSTQKSIDYELMTRKGIAGFYVYRGSSYPCALCDSMVGFHSLSMGELPPYHPRCCCFAVPI